MSASRYAAHLSKSTTPQSEPIPGKAQVANSAGGFVFAVDKWQRLDRFLVLGAEGGSYYASERTLTKENAQAVLDCADEDAKRTINRIVEISEAGRAPKNDPAIFALAMLATYVKTSSLVRHVLPKVCRIGTHLFQFVEACKALRPGWRRSLRSAVSAWYDSFLPEDLARQVSKYQQRNGWSHSDLLRLVHPKADDRSRQTIYHWIRKGWDEVGAKPHDDEALLAIWAMERAKKASVDEVCNLIRGYSLPRECVPTEMLTEAKVWDALLERMPMHAMVRNLATMTRVGVLAPMSVGTRKVLAELANVDRLRKSRLHPFAVLTALMTYKSGHGQRGSNTWVPVPQIVDALDGAFYGAFGNVEITGKRWMLALDVSGSMTSGNIGGVEGLTPRVAAAAMSLVTAATEPDHAFMAFSTYFMPLDISPKQRLDQVVRTMDGMPFAGTDCALPMIYANKMSIPVDVFVVYTDSETWQGNIHASQALLQYRKDMKIPAKLIVVGMVSNGFTIADPNDAGMLDVVGFDTSAPQLMGDFARQ